MINPGTMNRKYPNGTMMNHFSPDFTSPLYMCPAPGTIKLSQIAIPGFQLSIPEVVLLLFFEVLLYLLL